MPKRGSVQLLLLFFRARARWIGAALGGLVLLGLLHGEGPGLKSDIAQSLRQSAWRHALAGEPVQEPWPWDDGAPVAQSPVPRLGLLGLSAAVLTNADWKQSSRATRTSTADRRDPHLDLGDVAVGDVVTVTGADGVTQIYKVTRRHIIDPQAPAEGGPSEADPHLLKCAPGPCASALRLIIDAVHVDPGTSTAPNPEQKL